MRKPVMEMKVDLLKADEPEKDWSAWTDSEGQYEFRMVQPGRYLLGINLKSAPESQYPYSRTYYPGVAEKDKAKLISIGDGEKLEGINLVLATQLIERAVVGVVTWPDGRPGVGAIVFFELLDVGQSLRPKHAVVGGDGSFSLPLFQGHAFLIYAHVAAGASEYFHSEPIEVTPGEKTDPVRLILSKRGTGFDNNRTVRSRKK